MLRARIIAVQCARGVIRSRSLARRGEARGAITLGRTVRTFGDSSSSQVLAVPHAPPMLSTLAVEHNDLDGTTGEEVVRHGKEGEGEGNADPLQRHAFARDDLAGPVSELERSRRVGDLLYKIRGLVKANPSNKVDRAMHLLEEGRREGITDLSLYRAVFKHLLSVSRVAKDGPKKMSVLLEQLKKDGLQPDVKTCNKILDFYAQVHDSTAAQGIYDEMVSNNVAPDQRTLSHMIMAHSWGCPNAMYKAVEELRSKQWQASRGAYQGMIAVMGRREDWSGVIDTIQRMRAEMKNPTEAAFVMAFRAAQHLHQPEVARQLFEHRMELGLPPQEYAYVKLMVALLKDGKAEEALGYWRQLVCVNGLNGVQISMETYNLAVKSATKAGAMEEMDTVLEMMQAQGKTPNDDTYVSALFGLSGREDMERAQQLGLVEQAFEAIGRTGPPPSTRVQHRVAVAYANAQMWSKAVSMFGVVLERKNNLSPFGWECLLLSLVRLGRHQELKETFSRSMISDEPKVMHTFTSFGHVLRAAERLEDVEWALQLREMANGAGHGSIHLDNLVVKVLAGAGRLQEARDILEPWRSLASIEATSSVFKDSYQLLLAASANASDAEMTLHLLKEMRSAKPPHNPPPSSLAFVLAALKDNGRAGEAVALFENLCQQDVTPLQPEAACYVVVADAAFEAKDRQAAVKYCEEAKKRGLAASDGAVLFAEENSVGGDGASAEDAALDPPTVDKDANRNPASDQRCRS